jgi:hypothetical protein
MICCPGIEKLELPICKGSISADVWFVIVRSSQQNLQGSPEGRSRGRALSILWRILVLRFSGVAGGIGDDDDSGGDVVAASLRGCARLAGGFLNVGTRCVPRILHPAGTPEFSKSRGRPGREGEKKKRNAIVRVSFFARDDSRGEK